LLAAGGAVMLIFGLALKWAKVDFGGVTRSGNNPFDYFFTGGLAWLLVVAAGVIAVLLAAEAIDAGSTPWALILLFGTGLATLLMLIRLILGAGDGLDRAAGMWVAFIAAVISLGGAVLNFTTAGGKLSDLTDVDKMRDAFKGAGAGGGPSGPGSSSTPPPPPPPPPAP
jgi:chromate transport protein ChrA